MVHWSMINNTEILESEFVAKIDCNFPYESTESSIDLINEAIKISDNAVFSVIEELARIPLSDRSKISRNRLKTLLESINSKFEHPIKDKIIRVAHLIIDEKTQSVEEAMTLMEEVGKYNRLWGALSIVYDSADDKYGLLDSKFDLIRNKWSKIEP